MVLNKYLKRERECAHTLPQYLTLTLVFGPQLRSRCLTRSTTDYGILITDFRHHYSQALHSPRQLRTARVRGFALEVFQRTGHRS
jgi:hypothetical protein